MRLTALVALAPLLTFHQPARAQDSGLSPMYIVCVERAEASFDQWVIDECLSEELKLQETRLKSALESAHSVAVKAIDTEQAKWVKWREKKCIFSEDDYGNTAPRLAMECTALEAKKRADELEAMAR